MILGEITIQAPRGIHRFVKPGEGYKIVNVETDEPLLIVYYDPERGIVKMPNSEGWLVKCPEEGFITGEKLLLLGEEVTIFLSYRKGHGRSVKRSLHCDFPRDGVIKVMPYKPE